MEQEIKSGDYTFTLLNENSLGDFGLVSESIDTQTRNKLFKWALAKQHWFFLYIVRYKGDVIGRVEAKVINHSIPAFEIGIEVKSDCRNLGHGERMIEIVVDYLKNNLLARRIQAVVNVDNKPSNALFRKTCLSLEATLKKYSVTVEHDPADAHIYSVIF